MPERGAKDEMFSTRGEWNSWTREVRPSEKGLPSFLLIIGLTYSLNTFVYI